MINFNFLTLLNSIRTIIVCVPTSSRIPFNLSLRALLCFDKTNFICPYVSIYFPHFTKPPLPVSPVLGFCLAIDNRKRIFHSSLRGNDPNFCKVPSITHLDIFGPFWPPSPFVDNRWHLLNNTLLHPSPHLPDFQRWPLARSRPTFAFQPNYVIPGENEKQNYLIYSCMSHSVQSRIVISCFVSRISYHTVVWAVIPV